MKSFLVLLLFFLISCSESNRKAEHSFYYWKTTFTKDSIAETIIDKEGIRHFYIHYFDVDWDDSRYMPVPLAEIGELPNADPFIRFSFTPVVFITNRCFEQMNNAWCDSLAIKVRNKILFISNRLQDIKGNKKNWIDEIQVDCDWTVTTKERYFRFLLKLKELYPDKIISATIRLYPYKYYDKTGVPPVDKGLLMCYNLTDIRNATTMNSILDTKDLKQYLASKKYPLSLDIALPVFGWYVWFTGEKFRGIIYPDGNDLLTHDSRFFKKTGNNFWLTGDTLIGDNYLREGDVLRLEYPGRDELEKAAKMLHAKFPETKRIALYYWDESLIKDHEQVIHKIYTVF